MNQNLATKDTEPSTEALLAQECAKLDPEFERVLADESLLIEFSDWPKY